MSKKIELTESKFKKFIQRIVEQSLDINELTFDELKNSPRMESLRNAIDKNKIIGVVFVKDDGSVRAMCFRKYLKTQTVNEDQSLVKQKFNLINVIDLNVYRKLMKQTGGNKEISAKGSWRKIKLENVIAFVAGKEFVDLREENNILERFGENVYNSLTKTMVKAVERNQQENALSTESDNMDEPENTNPEEQGVLNIQEMVLRSVVQQYLANKK